MSTVETRHLTARVPAPLADELERPCVAGEGTGWREAGTEGPGFYSDWKTVYVNHDPHAV